MPDRYGARAPAATVAASPRFATILRLSYLFTMTALNGRNWICPKIRNQSRAIAGPVTAIKRNRMETWKADLSPVTDAARRIAVAEDNAIFNGYERANIVGIAEAGNASSMTFSDDYRLFPMAIAEATA